MASKNNDRFTVKSNIIPSALVFLIAVLVYGQYGLEGKLFSDDAFMLYSGQKFAEGVPPYVSSFFNIAPLGPMLMGMGVWFANLMDTNDLMTVRIMFFLISCLSAVFVYFLGRHLFQSIPAGLFSAFAFLGFFGYAERAASGPRDKNVMVLFELLNLYLTCRKKWFWAGFFGSLAFLTWQPMAVFGLVTFILACAQPRPLRLFALSRSLAGITLPVILVLSYFQYHHALGALIDGAVRFNLFYFPVTEQTIFRQVIAVFHGSGALLPVFGLLMMLCLYYGRFSVNASVRKTLLHDDFAPILLSFPFPVIWSAFLDFRSYDDFFVFLPFVALGFAILLNLALRHGPALTDSVKQKRPDRLITVGLCLTLISSAALTTRFNRHADLVIQQRAAAEIERRFGRDARLLAINVPQVPVLLQQTNPSPFLYVFFNFDCWIDDHNPGGFDGWLAQMESFRPEVVVYSYNPCVHMDKLRHWLNAHYQPEQIGPWQVYVRNAPPD